MGFSLDTASSAKLLDVHPKLASVVISAAALTTQPFVVYEGVRTLARQKMLKAKGKSRTMDSNHLIQADGYGHAVDLVPLIHGQPTWDWNGCYDIAFAMDRAATELGVANLIVWGGVWDKRLSAYGGSDTAMLKEVLAYNRRHAGSDFNDGPHFEIHV